MLENTDTAEFFPLSHESHFEKSTRDFIRASTHRELLRLEEQYRKTLKQEVVNMNKGETSSPYLREVIGRLLTETQEQIQKKQELIREQTNTIVPALTGEVPPGYQASKIELLQNGKIYIGGGDTRKKGETSTEGRLLQAGIKISYDEYLRKAQGKSIQIDDKEIRLHWNKKGYPILEWKNIQPISSPMEQKANKKDEFGEIKEESPELQKVKEILADLRKKILTDASPVSKKLFAGRKRESLDFSRTTYAAGKDMENLDYAQVMEDGGKIYSVWGEITDQIRPLIIVDREKLVVVFAGSIGRDNLIIPYSGFRWPKGRDMKSYQFQPKINTTWKL